MRSPVARSTLRAIAETAIPAGRFIPAAGEATAAKVEQLVDRLPWPVGVGMTGLLHAVDAAAWLGVMVPAGTPRPIVERLSKAVDAVMQAPDTRERLNTAGLEVEYRPTSAFGSYLKDQQARFAAIIKKNNIQIE